MKHDRGYWYGVLGGVIIIVLLSIFFTPKGDNAALSSSNAGDFEHPSLVAELNDAVERALSDHEQRLVALKEKEAALGGLDERYHWALDVYIQDIRYQMRLAGDKLLILALIVDEAEAKQQSAMNNVDAITAAVALRRFQLLSEAVDEKLEVLSAVMKNSQGKNEKSALPTV